MIHIFPKKFEPGRFLGPSRGSEGMLPERTFKTWVQIVPFWKKHKKSAYVTFYSLNIDLLCYGKNVKHL